MKLFISLLICIAVIGCSTARQDVSSPLVQNISVAGSDNYKSPASQPFPVRLSSGASFNPNASISSSCSARRNEVDRIKQLTGNNLGHFMRRGEAEKRVGIFYVELTESLIDDQC